MPSKSKSKGNAWELEVAKFLSELYKESFIRIPSSGAFVGGKNNLRKAALGEAQLQSKKGDIHPPKDWKYWNIECKSYGEFPFHQLWQGDVKILDSWIQQQKDVEDPGDLNLILVKISRRDRWVIFPANLEFAVDRSLNYKDWIITAWDDFWSKIPNQQLVQSYSTRSVSSIKDASFENKICIPT